MKTFCFIVINLIVLVSCVGSKKDISTQTSGCIDVPIDLSKIANERSLDDYIDSVEFIRLEADTNALIRFMNMVKIDGQQIYIDDQFQ